MNRLACARIATFARWARLRREDAKTCDRYFVTGLEARDDRINHRLDDALGLGLRAPQNAVHFVDDVCFIHENIAN